MRSLAKKRFRFHGLKRPKIRQDMKKENLYNLSRMVAFNTANKTYFQQKWKAKSMTRAYHGEVLKERQWLQLFSKVAPAVVPMSPQYLATSDGAEQAAGRGSGRTPAPGQETPLPALTPYMQMVYHPIERRLDTAVYRSLFASSTRQARQYVVHGQVTVNGKVMRYPGYLLNPGDLFMVNPERVLYGLGKKKELPSTKKKAAAKSSEDEGSTEVEESPLDISEQSSPSSNTDQALDEAIEDVVEEDEDLSENDPLAGSKRTLRDLRNQVKTILQNQKKSLSGTKLRELRSLTKDLRTSLSKVSTLGPSDIEDLETSVQAALSSAVSSSNTPSLPDGTVSSSASQEKASSSAQQDSELSAAEEAAVQAAILEARENPYDPAKPYHTPWQPRDYMSPFAFIPRYLEVNQNICAAVYLRHPVCYPGFSEVPTPFPYETNQLSFNWYLRRR